MAEGPGADTLKAALRHVLWIGGAPDAGKTTVARILAERHRFQLYLLDAAMQTHCSRATRERQPELFAFQALTMDERLVLPTPRVIADGIIRIGAERFGLGVEDLLALPKRPRVLAEGPCPFPELLAPLLSDLHQAVWLVPTAAFKRASATRRDKPTSRHQTSDPERATRNWLERDLLLDAHVRRQAAELGLTLLEVDGSKTPEEMAMLVEQHFGPHLT